MSWHLLVWSGLSRLCFMHGWSQSPAPYMYNGDSMALTTDRVRGVYPSPWWAHQCELLVSAVVCSRGSKLNSNIPVALGFLGVWLNPPSPHKWVFLKNSNFDLSWSISQFKDTAEIDLAWPYAGQVIHINPKIGRFSYWKELHCLQGCCDS